MFKVNIHDAKTNLSKYLEKVEAGEVVIICRRNVPIAELHPTTSALREPRQLGLAQKKYGAWTLPKTFFDPLPQELLDAFNGDT